MPKEFKTKEAVSVSKCCSVYHPLTVAHRQDSNQHPSQAGDPWRLSL